MSDPYVTDFMGDRIYVGDYVECRIDHYASIRRGERRRVQAIEDGNVVLNNNGSPYGTSQYRVCNFKLAGRHHAWHYNHKEADNMPKNTLYAALEIGDLSYEQCAAMANSEQNRLRCMRADTSFASLKEWINQRIRANPDERWLILSGTVLAEISAPPVTFRPL